MLLVICIHNMADLNKIYKCNVCGNIVEVVHSGKGELVCCEQPMEKLEEKSQDEGLEKHVPIITKTDKGYLVKVSSTEHPMQDDHYIEWVQLIADGNYCRKFLQPGDKPEAEFTIGEAKEVSAREYCNLHGLWQS